MRLWPRFPVTRLRLRPGDALLLTVPEDMTVERARLLAGRVQAAFPGHHVIVALQGVQLGVIEVQPEPIHGGAKDWPLPRGAGWTRPNQDASGVAAPSGPPPRPVEQPEAWDR